uniref:Reverse transcriptase domain-containing protein n=1 Tax=Sus scrofa TaxID=9823 RepID=A0A8D0P6D1_PIG
MIKILQSGHRGNLPQHNKATANTILNGEDMKSLPKIRNRQGHSLSPLSFNSFRSPSHSNHRRKRKETKLEKKGKLSLFADDMILYIENPKDATRKLLELFNESSKVAGCKINTQKSVALIYTNNNDHKEKLGKQSHLPLDQKK